MLIPLAIVIITLAIVLVWWKQQLKLKDHEILAKFLLDKNWKDAEKIEHDQ